MLFYPAALRSRIIARFTELETERTQINDRLATLDRATSHQDEPGLLDALPLLGDALPGLPAAFGLELIYNKQDHQVTIYATIPDTLAAIIATSEPPPHQPPPTRQDWAIPHNTPECDGWANHDNPDHA